MLSLLATWTTLKCWSGKLADWSPNARQLFFPLKLSKFKTMVKHSRSATEYIFFLIKRFPAGIAMGSLGGTAWELCQHSGWKHKPWNKSQAPVWDPQLWFQSQSVLDVVNVVQLVIGQRKRLTDFHPQPVRQGQRTPMPKKRDKLFWC